MLYSKSELGASRTVFFTKQSPSLESPPVPGKVEKICAAGRLLRVFGWHALRAAGECSTSITVRETDQTCPDATISRKS